MKREEIKNKLKEIVIDILEVTEEEVTDNANFFHDLGGDSLDAVELVMRAEREFSICISDEEEERIRTLGDAVDLVEQKMNNQKLLPPYEGGTGDVTSAWLITV